MEIRERKIDANAFVGAIAFNAAGQIVLGCSSARLKTFDIGTGVQAAEVSIGEVKMPALFSDDARLFAAWTPRKTVDVFDAATGQRQASIAAPAQASVLRFSPRGDTIAAGLADGAVRVWDISTCRMTQTMSTGLGEASALAFSPDGALLTAASFDTDIRIYEAKNGELRRRMEQFSVSAFAAEYSPDGSTLALAGVDRSIYLFDTAGQRLIRKMDAHPELVASLAFSPDGKRLLSAGCDETGFRKPAHVRLWDVATGQAIWTADVPSGVPAVRFAPAGNAFATLRVTYQATVWTIST